MNETQFQNSLQVIMEDWADGTLQDEEGNEYGVLQASTFEANGVLTNNKGLVVRLDDGSEFQVTIVQTK